MFRDVNSIDDKIALMKSVSAQRHEIRGDLLKERIGESTAQEDLAKLFKPITQEIKKEKEILETIVKQNNKSISDSGNVVDPDSRLTENDKQILIEHGLPLPSEVVANDIDVVSLIEKAKKVIDGRKLGARKPKATAEERELIDKTIAARNMYINSLNYIIASREYNHTKNKPGTSGNGIKIGKGLKIKNGQFGDLTINPEKIKSGKLEVYKGNRKVMSKDIDKDLFDLLTKRYNKQQRYSNDSIATFNRLLELSGLPTMTVKSQKANLRTIYYHDPNELISRLEELISAKSAGNTGVDNEINTVLDELLEIGEIKKHEYRKIYKSIFG